MSWISNVDEQSLGYDAPYTVTTAAKLAPRNFAYGYLIPSYYTADADAYSLGYITTGSYAAFASGFNWNIYNYIPAGAPTSIALHNATGAIVTSSTTGALYFTVTQSGEFFISVTGNSYSNGEYSLAYTPNYIGSVLIDITGTKSPGSTITASYSISDLNGSVNIYPVLQWERSSDGANWKPITGATSRTYDIQAIDSNQQLRVALTYIDNDGFFESFVSIPTEKVSGDTVNPTLAMSYPGSDSVVGISSGFGFVFSEPVKRGSGAITLKKADGTLVESFNATTAPNIVIDGTSLVLKPSRDLNYDTQYKVEFSSGAITDSSGNPYVQALPLNVKTVSPPSIATPSSTPTPLTGDTTLDAMTNGFVWQLSPSRTIDWSISYGFSGEYWTNPAVLIEHINSALSEFSTYANVKFNYLGHFPDPVTANKYGSEINVSIDMVNKFFDSSSTWAIGFFPNAAYNNYSWLYSGAPGDIYLNGQSQANYLSSYEPGSAGWSLMIHELGHTLGLKHPHDDGGTGRPTFNSIGMSSLNIDWATVMSYNDTAQFNLLSWDPATPMILDVLALQYLYGKNQATNTGDSVYELKEANFYLTLYDASGSDTLVATNASRAWTVVLPSINLTNLVDTKVGFAVPTSDLAGTPTTLYWLAGDFENVFGTASDDNIIGNAQDNTLAGGSGNDTLSGGTGNDILIGNTGTDLAEFSGPRSGYRVERTQSIDLFGYSSGYSVISTANSSDRALLLDIERVKFSDGSYAISELIDVTPPLLNAANPADEAVGVAIGSNITLTFNEPIERGTGNIVLKKIDGTVIATYASGSDTANVSISGSTLTLNPTADLAYSTAYKVELTQGAVKDIAGNNYAGTTSYDFTTGAAPNPPPSSGFVVDSTSTDAAVYKTVASAVAALTTQTFITVRAAHVESSSVITITKNGVHLMLEGTDTSARLVFQFAEEGTVRSLWLDGTRPADIIGNSFDNVLRGNDAANRFDGGAGNDKILGAGGDDDLFGGSGDDWLDGGAGFDIVSGGSGNDSLPADEGGPSGGARSRDVLMGGSGNDLLIVATEFAAHKVSMVGGSGNDVFRVASMIGAGGSSASDAGRSLALDAFIADLTASDGLDVAQLRTSTLNTVGAFVSQAVAGSGGDRSIDLSGLKAYGIGVIGATDATGAPLNAVSGKLIIAAADDAAIGATRSSALAMAVPDMNALIDNASPMYSLLA